MTLPNPAIPLPNAANIIAHAREDVYGLLKMLKK